MGHLHKSFFLLEEEPVKGKVYSSNFRKKFKFLKNRMFSYILFILCFSSLFLSPLICLEIGENRYSGSRHNQNYSLLLNSLNITKICEHVKFLSGLGSRTPGYPGYKRALSYIYQNFLNYGLKPGPFGYFENFSVIVPKVYELDLQVIHPTRFKVDEVWVLQPLGLAPCCTPPEGVEGRLIYVGYSPLEIKGINLNNSIALMEYDNGGNWLHLLSLEVKAIIFIEPDLYTVMQSSLNAKLPDSPKLTFKGDSNLIGIPLNIPRVVISQKEAQRLTSLLSEGEVRVNLKLRVEWEEVEATNIIGVLPGASDEVVVLSAYYDSQSYIIERAPGADEAIGIAFLMEIAEYFSKNPPRRTIWFLALGAHYGGLKGAREFVEKHFEDISVNIALWVNLDFVSDSGDLGIFFSGYFYYFEASLLRYMWLKDWLFGSQGKVRKIMEETKININVEDGLKARDWRIYLPTDVNFDHEPYVLAGGVGITIATANSFRSFISTPSDTYENTLGVEWRLRNMEKQVKFTLVLLTALIGELEFRNKGIGPTRYALPPNGGGFVTLIGKIVVFNHTKGWFEGVPNALVSIRALYLVGGAEVAGAGISIGGYAPRFYSLAKTNEDGIFVIHGLPAETTYSSSAQLGVGVAEVAIPSFIVEAFIFNEEGNIIYAPEMWQQRSDVFPIFFRVDKPQIGSLDAPRFFPVFRCGTIVLCNLVPPNNIFGIISVLDARSHTPPNSFGFTRDTFVEGEDINMVFVPGDLPIEIVIYDRKSSSPIGLLRKCSETNPEGEGLKVEEGKLFFLRATQLMLIKDFYLLNEYRLNFLSKYSVTSRSAQHFLNMTKRYLRKALQSISLEGGFDYLGFLCSSYIAWQYVINAYGYVRALINETINSTIFFFFLLIPFSILFTELVIAPKEGLRKILFSCIFFAVFTFLLSCFHPGFHLATNIYVVLIGISIIVFLTPIMSLLLGRIISLLKSFREEIMGKHFAEISRLGALTMSLSIGISNMRRRKLRTTLTLATITLIVFSLMSLTSIYTMAIVRVIPKPGKTYYDGIMISGFGYLPRILEEVLKSELSGQAIICPRTWIYTSSGYVSMLGSQLPGTQIKITKVSEDMQTEYKFSAILALTPEDPIFDQGIIHATDGSLPKIFGEFTAMIPDICAEKTGLKEGDLIYVCGYKLKIIGVFDSLILNNIIDLDQERVTPINWGVQWAGGIQHVPAQSVLIVPYSFARGLGYSPTQLVAKFINENENDIFAVAEDLSEKMPFIIYAGGKDRVINFQQQPWFSFKGFENLLLPIAISMLVILNSLLANVYERSREIGIYSTVGLSPIHIAGLFLSEVSVYAIVGAVFGSLFGLLGINILFNLNLMPQDFYPNFSSTIVIIALSLSMLITMISCLYPIFKASKFATPSIERVWKLRTEPLGDVWDIPLPFTSSVDEVDGVILFLLEYFRAFTTAEVGAFRVDKIDLTKEVKNGRIEKIIHVDMTLPPYDMGVSQLAHIIIYKDSQEPYYRYALHLIRKTGALYIWKKAVYRFVDALRKQLLLWRTLPSSDKREFIEKAKDQLKLNGGLSPELN